MHHITGADFTPATPVCTLERLRQAIHGGKPPDVLVAHNCAFERLFLEAALPAAVDLHLSSRPLDRRRATQAEKTGSSAWGNPTRHLPLLCRTKPQVGGSSECPSGNILSRLSRL